jgi:hypothetical protein
MPPPTSREGSRPPRYKTTGSGSLLYPSLPRERVSGDRQTVKARSAAQRDIRCMCHDTRQLPTFLFLPNRANCSSSWIAHAAHISTVLLLHPNRSALKTQPELQNPDGKSDLGSDWALHHASAPHHTTLALVLRLVVCEFSAHYSHPTLFLLPSPPNLSPLPAQPSRRKRGPWVTIPPHLPKPARRPPPRRLRQIPVPRPPAKSRSLRVGAAETPGTSSIQSNGLLHHPRPHWPRPRAQPS